MAAEFVSTPVARRSSDSKDRPIAAAGLAAASRGDGAGNTS